VAKPKKSLTAVERRAEELDTIAAVLPMERRDKLAELLTDQDVETLRHLVNQGMGDNTLRALTSDLTYLEAWGLGATGKSLPWPAPEALLLKFVAHHLWDPQRQETDTNHGMPADVDENLRSQGFLKSVGPHAPATVRRRLANWSTLTKWRGLDGAFASPALKSAIRLAVRAVPRTRGRKSAKAVTGDVLAKLLATCATDSLRDLRDRAILMVAFASGGRRRSEIADLRREQLTVEPPIPVENGAPPPLSRHPSRSHQNHLRRTGRCRLSHRPAGGGAECLDRGGQHRQRERVSSDRAMGNCFEAGDRSSVGQCNLEAAGGDGWVGGWRVFCAWTAVRISDGSGKSRYSSSRSDGTIASPLSPTSLQLL
jgi:hypothetical protein